MLLVFLELCVHILIFGFMLTQVVFPIWHGKKLFPAFRKSTIKVEQERAVIQDELENAKVETEIDQLTDKLEEIRETKRRRKTRKEEDGK